MSEGDYPHFYNNSQNLMFVNIEMHVDILTTTISVLYFYFTLSNVFVPVFIQ